MSAPIIALTATTRMVDGLPRVRLNEAYVDAARAVGLVPLVVPPLDPSELESVVEAVEGVVLTGGEDVDPSEFGAAAHPRAQQPQRERDRCEIALVQLARKRRLPTLAICRGIQVVNVALGGTLVQDIPSERPSELRHDEPDRRTVRIHDVAIDAGSRLASALGTTHVAVNSSHHQSLDRVAEGLRITARAPDGIIEGAEWTGDDWWMLAVQWHPEELVHDAVAADRGLFQAFAQRVTAGRRRS